MQSKENTVIEGSLPGDGDGEDGQDGQGERADDAATDRAAGDVADEPEPVETRALGLDQVFEVLKNQRRRYVLQHLRERDEQVSLSELSEQIAAWENGKEIRAITSDERKRVYVGLYQCHLPKMDGMGVVEFNKPRATIAPGENIDLLYTYLDAPGDDRNAEFSKYYLGLSAVMLGGLVIAALIEPTVQFPVLVVTAGIAVLAFSATAVLQYTAGEDSNGIGTLLSGTD